MIKKITFLLFFFIYGFQAYSQQYEISFSPGLMGSSDWGKYDNSRPGAGGMLTFNYQVSSRFSVFSHYHFGRFSSQINNGLRSPIQTEYISFGVSKHFLISPTVKLGIGTGIGLVYETSVAYFPVYSTATGRFEGEYTKGKRSVRDFNMPLMLTVKKDFNELFFYGLTTGVNVTPFYVFGGFHIAPTIGIRL